MGSPTDGRTDRPTEGPIDKISRVSATVRNSLRDSQFIGNDVDNKARKGHPSCRDLKAVLRWRDRPTDGPTQFVGLLAITEVHYSEMHV